METYKHLVSNYQWVIDRDAIFIEWVLIKNLDSVSFSLSRVFFLRKNYFIKFLTTDQNKIYGLYLVYEFLFYEQAFIFFQRFFNYYDKVMLYFKYIYVISFLLLVIYFLSNNFLILFLINC